MTHRHGVAAEPVRHFAWDTFVELTELAKRLHLDGVGQGLLADAFVGNVRGAGPGVAEMEIQERPSEPLIVFAADETSPGRVEPAAVQDLLRSVKHRRLMIDESMHAGLTIERAAFFHCPRTSMTPWSTSTRPEDS